MEIHERSWLEIGTLTHSKTAGKYFFPRQKNKRKRCTDRKKHEGQKKLQPESQKQTAWESEKEQKRSRDDRLIHFSLIHFQSCWRAGNDPSNTKCTSLWPTTALTLIHIHTDSQPSLPAAHRRDDTERKQAGGQLQQPNRLRVKESTYSADWVGWHPQVWFSGGGAAACICSQNHNPEKQQHRAQTC